MKSLSLVVYYRGIFSLRNEWASSSSERFWERKREERKYLAWSADSPFFIYFLGIQKISQLCCDRSLIHIWTIVFLHSLKELTNLTAQNNFTEKTGLIYTLNGFCDTSVLTTWLALFLLVSFWCEITHGQCTNILNGPELRHSLDMTVPAYAAKWPIVADALLPRNQTDGSVSSGILQ